MTYKVDWKLKAQKCTFLLGKLKVKLGLPGQTPMVRAGKAGIFRTKSLRRVWGLNNSVFGGLHTFFSGKGLELQYVHTNDFLGDWGSTWLINICLTAVQKKPFSLLMNVVSLVAGVQTSCRSKNSPEFRSLFDSICRILCLCGCGVRVLCWIVFCLQFISFYFIKRKTYKRFF